MGLTPCRWITIAKTLACRRPLHPHLRWAG
jgi:hypothetical protein